MSGAGELGYRSTTELMQSLGAGDVSSVELLEHLLSRVGRLNPPINAVVALDPDGARARARAADEARSRGESWGPLHGLPMTVKDSIEVVGMPTTSGARELADHRPTRDADTVQRLRDAGAIVFGKTNLPLYAGDFQSYNEVYGTTNNPWDVTRGPGGSSGGSAAALAAGLTPLELGSDIGGSIRNPSHYCGVFGHKPSWGIVSGRGHIPGPPGALAPSDLAVLGPLARTAGDLDLALGILAGPAPGDDRAWRLALPAPRHQRLADHRVAFWTGPRGRPLAGDVAALLQAAVDRIAAAGASVDGKAFPAIDPDASHARYLRLLYSVLGAGFPPPVLEAFQPAYAALDAADQGSMAQTIRGVVGPHRAWLSDDEARHHLRARWAEFFCDFDVLLMPVASVAAFPHDHSPLQERVLSVDGRDVPYLEELFWAGFATVAHLPSTVVPIGRTPAGLPVGVQIVGPRLEDRTPIHFAALVEKLLGGFVPPPGHD